MLLSKVHYAIGDYQTALDCLDEASLDKMSFTDISSRKLKLIGECFAIKGSISDCVMYLAIAILHILIMTDWIVYIL